MLAYFTDAFTTSESAQAGIHKEERDTLSAGLGIGFGTHNHQFRLQTIGDKYLGTIDYIAIICTLRGGAHSRQITACPRLGHGNCTEDVTPDHSREIAFFLGFRTKMQNIWHNDISVDVIATRQATKALASYFGDRQLRDFEAGCCTAILLRHINSKHSGLPQRVPNRAWNSGLLLPLVIVRCNFLIKNPVDHFMKQRGII